MCPYSALLCPDRGVQAVRFKLLNQAPETEVFDDYVDHDNENAT